MSNKKLIYKYAHVKTTRHLGYNKTRSFYLDTRAVPPSAVGNPLCHVDNSVLDHPVMTPSTTALDSGRGLIHYKIEVERPRSKTRLCCCPTI